LKGNIPSRAKCLEISATGLGGLANQNLPLIPSMTQVLARDDLNWWLPARRVFLDVGEVIEYHYRKSSNYMGMYTAVVFFLLAPSNT
jgi:hypothetical protein